MYETKSKSLWRRMAALCAAAVLALTACVQCAYAQEKTVIPLGQAVGIKLFANGVLVVDVSALEGVGGKSPAQKCGIREGDLLLTFNGKKIASTEHLQELLRQNGTQPAQSFSGGGRIKPWRSRPPAAMTAVCVWARGFATAWPASAP